MKTFFNAAFLSFWMSGLCEDSHMIILESLETVISSPRIPVNELQPILIILEYVDHDESSLPVSFQILRKQHAKLVRTRKYCGTKNNNIDYIAKVIKGF